MSSASSDNLTSSFSIWLIFISFYLIVVTGTSYTMLNKSDEIGCPCLVSACHYWIWCWIWVLYYVEVCSSYSHFVVSFIKWLFSIKFFFCIYWGDAIIFILPFINVAYHIDLWMWHHPWVPGVGSTLSWFMIFEMYYWIQLTNIFWRFFHLCSSGMLMCNFLFHSVFFVVSVVPTL